MNIDIDRIRSDIGTAVEPAVTQYAEWLVTEENFERDMALVAAFMVVGDVLDYKQTRSFVSDYGIGCEGNPIQTAAIRLGGWRGFWTVKLVVNFLVAKRLYSKYHENDGEPFFVKTEVPGLIFTLLFTLVTNAIQMKRWKTNPPEHDGWRAWSPGDAEGDE